MRKIIYYVASSIDGYIAGQNGDVSGFIYDGSGVQQYLKDLEAFDTVIMGRKTYEFGYQFGMKPGQPAYPNKRHLIFSNSLSFEEQDSSVKVCKLDIAEIEALKSEAGTDIYLCGGGELAGWLLAHQQVDVLKIKLNPLVLGQGTRLFGECQTAYKAELVDSQVYEKGIQIMTFHLRY